MRERHRAMTLVCVAALLAGAAPARAQDSTQTLTLDACIAQAASNSQTLLASRFQNDAARARAENAQAKRWPRIGADASYDYASEILSIGFPSAPPVSFGDGNTYRVSVGVDVPLYTGGAMGATARAERAEANATALDVVADSLGVVRDVRSAYFHALASRSQLEVARVAVRRLDRHLDRITQQIGVGASSEAERVQTTARLREAEQRMLGAESRSITDEIALGSAIGLSGERIAPGGNLDASLLGGTSLAPDMVDSRPELASLAVRRDESDLRARAAWGALLPSVVAGARWNYGRPGVDPITNDWMSWGTAHVGLAWTLFDRGARHQNVDAARATARAIDATRTDLHQRLQSAFETAKVRLDYAERQSEKATERLQVGKQWLDLVTGRHDQGMATETELLDAVDDLADAEASDVAARVAVRLAESDLLYAVGR
jgi:outer membrane protein